MIRPNPAATSQPDLLPPERVLAGFALSEEVISLLNGYLVDLVDTLPALCMRRGFTNGAWRIGAHREGFGACAGNDAEDGAMDGEGAGTRARRPDVSRIDFELRVDVERERLDLIARTTIRDRDHRPERFATHIDDAGQQALRAWIETMLLDFADRYTSRRHSAERHGRA